MECITSNFNACLGAYLGALLSFVSMLVIISKMRRK